MSELQFKLQEARGVHTPSQRIQEALKKWGFTWKCVSLSSLLRPSTLIYLSKSRSLGKHLKGMKTPMLSFRSMWLRITGQNSLSLLMSQPPIATQQSSTMHGLQLGLILNIMTTLSEESGKSLVLVLLRMWFPTLWIDIWYSLHYHSTVFSPSGDVGLLFYLITLQRICWWSTG